MRIQLLGPIRIWRDGNPVAPGPPAQRATLGLLALAMGQPLHRAELVSALWGDQPPPSTPNMLQSHIKHLRRLLEPDRQRYAPSTVLPAVGDGYALQVSPDEIDVHNFRMMVDAATAAQRTGDPRRAADLLAQGLRMWQGSPLVDVPLLAGHPKVVALSEQRSSAIARYGEMLAVTGDLAEALPVLQEAASAHPLDEVAAALLIRAYHAAGQRARAIGLYHDIRRRLADELGIDPGRELVAAYAVLLGQDTGARGVARRAKSAARSGAGTAHHLTPSHPGRGGSRTRVTSAPTFRPRPAQVPADTTLFTGRTGALRDLDALLLDLDRAGTTAVVIAAISGTAGVGKTALVVHWAHRVADRFPDGQLYVNLRGADPAGTAVTPSEAIRGFLDALGIPPAQIPVSLDAQAALYRSALAGRRMLIVLDNARDADQVYPLLPGTPGCLVVVASRVRLGGLVTTAGAHPFTLGLFSAAEAREFLTCALGGHRVATDPTAVDSIVAWCARLPLALGVVAARAADQPDFPLARLATRPERPLDAFHGGDSVTNLRSVFSWSYDRLTADAAELFRTVGLHTGPDVAAPALASLAGTGMDQIYGGLTELTRTSLLEESSPDRFACHDLLRAYATELAESVDAPADRHRVLHRMLDHYLHTAHSAAVLLNPDREPLTLGMPQPGVMVEKLADDREALAWLTAEHEVLVAAIGRAAAAGFDRHVWQLAWTLANFFDRQGRWHAWAETQTAALQAAQRLGDRAGQAHSHRNLAGGCVRLGRYDEAHAHLQHALRLYDEIGDTAGKARACLNLGWLCSEEGHYDQAIRHALLALRLAKAAGSKAREAAASNAVGWCHAQLGSPAEALPYCRRAVAVYRELGDRLGQATSLDSLGYVHNKLGRQSQAIRHYRDALDLYRDMRNQGNVANVLVHLGDAHHAAGAIGAALKAWQEAVDVLDGLHHPDAGRIYAKLRGLPPALPRAEG